MDGHRSGGMVKRKQGIEELLWPREPLELQHPKLVAAPPTGANWIHEPKYDGYRMQAQVRDGRARLFTRRGFDWTDKLPVIAAFAGELPNCVLDGELSLLGPEGYSTFSGLRAAIGSGGDYRLTLMVFDIMWRDETDLRPYPLERRLLTLKRTLEEADHVLGRICSVQQIEGGEGAPLLEAACRLKWEGIVSKRLDSPYRGGRQDAWVKSKCRPSETVVIGGWVSRGGIGFSHLLAGVREDDGRLRYAGSIKGGFASEPGLLRRLRAIESPASPFDIDSPRKKLEIHWVKPDLQAEVEMAEFTASGKLRQATFKGLRDDLA